MVLNVHFLKTIGEGARPEVPSHSCSHTDTHTQSVSTFFFLEMKLSKRFKKSCFTLKEVLKVTLDDGQKPLTVSVR